MPYISEAGDMVSNARYEVHRFDLGSSPLWLVYGTKPLEAHQ